MSRMLMKPMLKSLFPALCAFVLAAPALGAGQPAKYKTNPPPAAELRYGIEAKQSGLSLDGSAVVQWKRSGKQFSVHTETRAKLLGKIMDARTEGVIDEFGLAPLSFQEKRFGKPASTTRFDRDARVIRFSTSDQTLPLQAGTQDRNSIVWQLVAVARAAPARMKPGSEWHFFVASQRDAELWTFKVQKSAPLQTPLGMLDTVQLTRLPPDGKGQQLDIWLAPQRDWYPVRLRFADDGDTINQTIEAIQKQ